MNWVLCFFFFVLFLLFDRNFYINYYFVKENKISEYTAYTRGKRERVREQCKTFGICVYKLRMNSFMYTYVEPK